jgi:hypothetical protein
VSIAFDAKSFTLTIGGELPLTFIRLQIWNHIQFTWGFIWQIKQIYLRREYFWTIKRICCIAETELFKGHPKMSHFLYFLLKCWIRFSLLQWMRQTCPIHFPLYNDPQINGKISAARSYHFNAGIKSLRSTLLDEIFYWGFCF